jgi:hypothetical protein
MCDFELDCFERCVSCIDIDCSARLVSNATRWNVVSDVARVRVCSHRICRVCLVPVSYAVSRKSSGYGFYDMSAGSKQ